MNVEGVVVAVAQRIEIAHGDVGELGAAGRNLAGECGAEAEAGKVDALAGIVAVVRKAVEPVTHGHDGGGVDGENIVELRGIHLTLQTPLARGGDVAEVSVAGL